MSSSRRIETNKTPEFELAGPSRLRQMDLPGLRNYNRDLTAEYESVVIENGSLKAERDAWKKKAERLEQDNRELETILDNSDSHPVTSSEPSASTGVEAARAKIATLESALAEAQSAVFKIQMTPKAAHASLQTASTENASLRSGLQAPKPRDVDIGGSRESKIRDWVPHSSEASSADDNHSNSPPPRFVSTRSNPVIIPPEEGESGEELFRYYFGSESQEESEPEGPAAAAGDTQDDPVISGHAGDPSASLDGNLDSQVLVPPANRQETRSQSERIAPTKPAKRDASEANLDSDLNVDSETSKRVPIFSLSTPQVIESKKPRFNLFGDNTRK
ncbi:MAG: hypothetical protein L6R42_000839 [Xanthoria sp. 1 TBL-2021]|nr:MAG: hypothetical protein L6R42_000839 [Xanthoria sp. 1 TBL-2021]